MRCTINLYIYMFMVGRIFNSIAQQVNKNISQEFFICMEFARQISVHGHVQLVRVITGSPHFLADLLHKITQVERTLFYFKFDGIRFAYCQNIVKQRSHMRNMGFYSLKLRDYVLRFKFMKMLSDKS